MSENTTTITNSNNSLDTTTNSTNMDVNEVIKVAHEGIKKLSSGYDTVSQSENNESSMGNTLIFIMITTFIMYMFYRLCKLTVKNII